eukprot:TRINITY_DN36332_c0_g1_i1.p1 TRINITY_DN36332_c0_g1~~TRINITY_DN36332_c0_g1_i1.p1  ORF type:complete len:240 (+),score=71.24 TRINITY_DN36332_c0_g1_i1:74-793(+)
MAEEAAMPDTADNEPLLVPARENFSRTVVIDMDETLLHSVRVPPRYARNTPKSGIAAQRRGNTLFLDWAEGLSLRVYLRPGLDAFLKFLASHFELVLWTAGTKPYAQEIVKLLDPKDSLFTHVIARDTRWFHNEADGQGYAKNLGKLGRSLDSTVLIDNSAFVCRFNFENSIIVSDWNRSTLKKRDDVFHRLRNVLVAWRRGEEKVTSLISKSPHLYHTRVGEDTFCHTTYPLKVQAKL